MSSPLLPCSKVQSSETVAVAVLAVAAAAAAAAAALATAAAAAAAGDDGVAGGAERMQVGVKNAQRGP